MRGRGALVTLALGALAFGCDTRKGLGEVCIKGGGSTFGTGDGSRPYHYACADHLLCSERTGMCVEAPPLGGLCYDDFYGLRCDEGALCDGNVCVEPPGEDAMCLGGVCASGLLCSNSGTCRPPAEEGNDCSDAWCGDGLWCDPDDDTCADLADSGGDCTTDDGCDDDLICNFGFGDGHRGICARPQGEGDPCAWRPMTISGLPRFHDVGCESDLMCQPIFADPLTQPADAEVDPVSCWTAPIGSELANNCWYRGTCEPLHTVPEGGRCGSAYACEEGTGCGLVPPPCAAEPRPGYGADLCYQGAWPGFCGNPTDDGPSESCISGSCFVGSLCTGDDSGICVGAHTMGEGQACPDVDLCALDLSCDPSTRRCIP